MTPTEKLRYKKMADFGFGPIVMKKTKVCVNCGQMAKRRGKVCPVCGMKLPRETLFDRYKRQHISCAKCSTVLASDSRYCPHCGKAVLKANQKINQIFPQEEEK